MLDQQAQILNSCFFCHSYWKIKPQCRIVFYHIRGLSAPCWLSTQKNPASDLNNNLQLRVFLLTKHNIGASGMKNIYYEYLSGGRLPVFKHFTLGQVLNNEWGAMVCSAGAIWRQSGSTLLLTQGCRVPPGRVYTLTAEFAKIGAQRPGLLGREKRVFVGGKVRIQGGGVACLDQLSYRLAGSGVVI